jgi:hypothetical protein
MSIFKKILIFIAITNPLYLSANQDIIFLKLNDAIANYSKKIEECDLKTTKLVMNDIDNDLAIETILSKPFVLSYLSEKATDTCLQPQKGLLAEAILYTKGESKLTPAYKLGLTTQKMVFLPSFESEVTFKNLGENEQNALLSIQKFHSPFDALHLYELIRDSRAKAM